MPEPMTDDHLDAIERSARVSPWKILDSEVLALVAEVRRLRGGRCLAAHFHPPPAYSCSLGYGHDGPHRDRDGSEWEDAHA